MIKGLQKKESFSFQDADYKDENVLEVKCYNKVVTEVANKI